MIRSLTTLTTALLLAWRPTVGARLARTLGRKLLFPQLVIGETTMRSRSLLVASVVALSGCAITQNVTPIGLDQRATELCLVKNSEVVQDGFHEVYERVLQKKGFKVRWLPDKSPVTSCPLVGTYEVIYRWDLAIYLARADLRIYSEGKEAGRAVYDSLSGGANMSKFIRTEPKLTELIDQLFPKLKAFLRTKPVGTAA